MSERYPREFSGGQRGADRAGARAGAITYVSDSRLKPGIRYRRFGSGTDRRSALDLQRPVRAHLFSSSRATYSSSNSVHTHGGDVSGPDSVEMGATAAVFAAPKHTYRAGAAVCDSPAGSVPGERQRIPFDGGRWTSTRPCVLLGKDTSGDHDPGAEGGCGRVVCGGPVPAGSPRGKEAAAVRRAPCVVRQADARAAVAAP